MAATWRRVYCSACSCTRATFSIPTRGLRARGLCTATERSHGIQSYSSLVQTPVQSADNMSGDSVVSPPRDNPLSQSDLFGVQEMTSLRELFEARVHLGHKASTWNPLMKPYIYGTRAGMHIFDLEQTQRHLQRAMNVAGHVAYRNGVIIFVNERPQFERLVQHAARESGEYFVSQRWRPGTLTNSYKLLGTLRLPDLVVFLSVPPSKTAIKEVAMCSVPSIGIVDSDCDPRLIAYPIPGNDDTPTAMRLYCELFSHVIMKAKKIKKEHDK